MKKACLTVRQQQMSQLQQKGELPLSMMDQVGREGLAATLPKPLPLPKRQSSDFSDLAVDKPGKVKRKPPQPSLDLFTREIQVTCLQDCPGSVIYHLKLKSLKYLSCRFLTLSKMSSHVVVMGRTPYLLGHIAQKHLSIIMQSPL